MFFFMLFPFLSGYSFFFLTELETYRLKWQWTQPLSMYNFNFQAQNQLKKLQEESWLKAKQCVHRKMERQCFAGCKRFVNCKFFFVVVREIYIKTWLWCELLFNICRICLCGSSLFSFLLFLWLLLLLLLLLMAGQLNF